MATKPLNDEQKRDAKRLREIFELRQSTDPSLTQESLADACGWKTQGAVSQYLLGKIPLNLSALMKFSKALNTPPSSISPSLASEINLTVAQVLDEYKVLQSEMLTSDEVELLAAYRATSSEGKSNTLFSAKANSKAYPSDFGTKAKIGGTRTG